MVGILANGKQYNGWAEELMEPR